MSLYSNAQRFKHKYKEYIIANITYIVNILKKLKCHRFINYGFCFFIIYTLSIILEQSFFSHIFIDLLSCNE